MGAQPSFDLSRVDITMYFGSDVAVFLQQHLWMFGSELATELFFGLVKRDDGFCSVVELTNRLLVAQVGKEIVGLAGMLELPREMLIINSLYVGPRFRRMGISHSFGLRALQYAVEFNIPMVAIQPSSTAAVELCKKLQPVAEQLGLNFVVETPPPEELLAGDRAMDKDC